MEGRGGEEDPFHLFGVWPRASDRFFDRDLWSLVRRTNILRRGALRSRSPREFRRLNPPRARGSNGTGRTITTYA